MHGNYLEGSFHLLGHIFKVTEPLRNTLVGTHLYVCLFGVDVCWYKRWDINWLLVAVILTSCFFSTYHGCLRKQAYIHCKKGEVVLTQYDSVSF